MAIFQARARVCARKMSEKYEKSTETAFPGDLTLCWIREKLSQDNKTPTGPSAIFFEKMNELRLIFRSSGVSYYTHFFSDAGVAKWLCSSFPSWLRRFDSGRPLHFFTASCAEIGVLLRENTFPSGVRSFFLPVTPNKDNPVL